LKTLTWVIPSLLLLGCYSLQGSIESDRYTEPKGRFSFEVPSQSWGQLSPSERYIENLDRGFVEFANDMGLTGVYFSPGFTSGLDIQSRDRKAELEKSLTTFWMTSIFLARTGEAQILHNESVSVDNEEMLFAIVNISGASGAWNMGTGEVFDAKVGALLFVRGEHVFLLSTQNNMTDSQYERGEDSTSADLASITENSMRVLENLYHSFRFE
jgi:hypothetical protein